jgi:hypothetical protein
MTGAIETHVVRRAAGLVLVALVAAVPSLFAQTHEHHADRDPRVGLAPGLHDAGVAMHGMELLANAPKPQGFFDPASPGEFNFANSDLAFRDDLVFVGNFWGFQVFDVSDPANPSLRVAVVCPGGQGDVSVFGDLLFMSVEMPNGRIDCGTQGVREAISAERFRGVRIFDISNLDEPRQVAAVQTCRGSHTHTLVTDPNDDAHVYVYVSGAAGIRPAAELAGCSTGRPDEDPETSLFRIEVIRVPLARPQDAAVVSAPRVFADRETGAIAGLWPGGGHGEGTQRTAQTNHCHDITAYPAIGLAAGACSGNGILLDISDPANPVRIHEVVDPNFAYWHSATFNNAGTTVIFTDEWGGGMAPRCRETDAPEWGANSLFRIEDGRMSHAGYYKLPAPQTNTENCVAHNGSLVPVPGRDIKVQAWYQGGISVLDFTDPANAFEIAFFDRGPISATQLMLGGHWSAYWYNGHIYGSEIVRGLDVLRLVPNEHISQNEIDAANLVRFDEFNPQLQPRMSWESSVVVARAYLDQLSRSGALSAERVAEIARVLDETERAGGAATAEQLEAQATQLDREARAAEATSAIDARRMRLLARTMRELAAE